MKRFLSICVTLLMVSSAVYAHCYSGVYNDYQVVYSPSANTWSNGGMVEDRVVLTKKTSDGTGSYSQYYDKNGVLVIALGSNFEFLKDGKFIASHNAELKFYNVVYNEGKFSEVLMNETEVQNLFPDAEIIKVSQFKDGKYKIKKRPFEKKKVLLLNDTDGYYHKYSFAPSNVKKTDIAGLITISKFGKIKFSHCGVNNEMFPMLQINVGM